MENKKMTETDINRFINMFNKDFKCRIQSNNFSFLIDLFENYINQGNSYMDAYYLTAQAVTIPGASEHEIGLALDIVSDKYSGLNEGFGASDAGIWLEKHCTEYGFVIRYPLGKESITGIEFEPWHFRYVGKKAAKVMKEQNLCLEEFTELIMENSPDK